MKINLVRCRVSDLGFTERALTREIIGSECDRDVFGHSTPFTSGLAMKLGLELCPPKVGPTLRLEYTDQPLGESVHIAMKPIITEDGEPRIFVVAHNSAGLSLETAVARPDDKWGLDEIFVFCTDKALA